MKVKFDALNRFEVPKLYVCNPGCEYKDGVLSRVIGCLSDTTDEELVMNFNATSELNFRAHRIMRDDKDVNAYTLKLYRALQNRRLIFVEDVGFFVITGIEDGYENGVYYKDVRAESCEIEIENKMLTYIEDGTYAFTDLLETIVATLPAWTTGSIDNGVAEKHRTFEDVSAEINTLAFLIDNVQDAYECIFVFDVINRQIHVYDQNNYVVQTQIHITKDDVINSIEISESSDDLYTAISVLGDDNLNIVPINPLGTNVIYNFDYYLDWMTPELSERVTQWSDLVKSHMSTYYDLNLEYYEKLTSQSDLKSELERLETQMTMYRRCRENIVAENSTENVAEYNTVIEENGGTAISIGKEIEETLAEIDNQLAIAQDAYDDTSGDLDALNVEIQNLNTKIEAIHSEVSITEYFTSDEYNELYNYIFEGVYNDQYITVTESMTYSEKFAQMKVLYDRAAAQLVKVSQPTQEFSVNVENFIFQKDFERWSEQLETGCLINVELDVGDVALLFLSNIVVNYDDRSLTLTFGNRFNKFDPKSIFNDVLGDIKKSSNTIDYIKDAIYPIKNGGFNAMKEALENSRTLTKNAALASTNEEVVIDDTGYTGRKILSSGEYDPRQIKITGKSIVFTDDAWETCKIALGELILSDDETVYGINAQALFGQVIMGNSLHIVDSNGTPLLEVVDGKISTAVGDIDKKFTSITQDADKLVVRVSALENAEDPNSITTETGYTFDKEGLKIHKDGEEITNKLDNTGMYVSRGEGDTEAHILIANNLGVEAINLTAKQYLIVGANSRFENYATDTDPNRTGCFYIGSTIEAVEVNE